MTATRSTVTNKLGSAPRKANKPATAFSSTSGRHSSTCAVPMPPARAAALERCLQSGSEAGEALALCIFDVVDGARIAHERERFIEA